MAVSVLHDKIDEIVKAIRSFVRWLLLAIASPTVFTLLNWMRSRRKRTVSSPPRRKPVRDWLTRRRERRL